MPSISFLRSTNFSISNKGKTPSSRAIFFNSLPINFSELKRFLDEEHEEQEWIRIRRKRNEAYRVAGNDGRDEMALRMNNFPNAIVDYFRDHL